MASNWIMARCFLRALREGLIDPKRSVQIGIRSFSEDDYGFTVMSSPWIAENGVRATVLEIQKVVGRNKAYLTFDIDCLDPAYAPGTGTRRCGWPDKPSGVDHPQRLGACGYYRYGCG